MSEIIPLETSPESEDFSTIEGFKNIKDRMFYSDAWTRLKQDDELARLLNGHEEIWVRAIKISQSLTDLPDEKKWLRENYEEYYTEPLIQAIKPIEEIIHDRDKFVTLMRSAYFFLKLVNQNG